MRYLIALLLPMVVFAKDPPIPEALLNAKTAFVEKVGSAQESLDMLCEAPNANAEASDKEHNKYCKSLKKEAKADKQLFDNVCKALKKWGRLTLVQDRSSADVRILLARTWNNAGTRLTKLTYPPSYNEYRIYTNTSAITYTVGDTIFGVKDGITYSFHTTPTYQLPVYQAPMTSYETVYLSSREEAIINIRDGRNDFLLYLDQTEGPGTLVSNLKHKMKRK